MNARKRMTIIAILVLMFTFSFCASGKAELLLPPRPAYPWEEVVSEEQAVEIAKTALMQNKHFSENRVNELERNSHFAFVFDGQSKYAWVISYCVNHEKKEMYVVTVDSTSGEILDTRDGTREEIYSEFWGRDEYRQCLDREWSRFLASLYACKGFMSQETTMGNHRSFPADIATPTEADITEEMAVNIANVELLQNIGLTQKQANETKASFVLMREEEPYVYAWIVTYCLHKEDKIFSVIIDSSVGSILDTHYGSSDEIRMRFEDEKKVSFHDWTLRKQALWSTLFDCPSIGIFNVLPTEEAVTEEEVLEIAVRWLNYEYGETEDSLSKYHVSFSFYETFPEPLSFMDWVLSIFLSDSNDSPPSSSYYWYIHFCDLSDEWGLYPAYDLPVYTVIVDADGKGFYGINTDWRAKNLVYNDALPD